MTIQVGDPGQNPRNPSLTPPRMFTNEAPEPFYDTEAIMANYDPYVEANWGGVYHIDSKLTSEDIEVPRILVIPKTDWIPPYENTPITGPYGYFVDYYRDGTPEDWYDPSMVANNSVGPAGLTWGPYP